MAVEQEYLALVVETAPRAPDMAWHQIVDGPRCIGIHHHVIMAVFSAILQHHAITRFAFEHQTRHWAVQTNGAAQADKQIRQRLHQLAAATFGMPHAKAVFDQRQDAEETWAFCRRHPQILALEAHRDLGNRMRKIGGIDGLERSEGGPTATHLSQSQDECVKWRVKRVPQDRFKSGEFFLVQTAKFQKCIAIPEENLV